MTRGVKAFEKPVLGPCTLVRTWGTRLPWLTLRRPCGTQQRIVSVTVFQGQYGKAGRRVAHEMADIGLWITLQVK
jgi:hypothetical protein